MDSKKIFQNLYNSLSQSGFLPHVSTILKRAYTLWPLKTAFVFKNKELSYKSLYESSVILSKKLKNDFNIQANDKIIILSENSFEFLISYFAVWNLGCIVVPLSTFLSESELEKIILDCECKILLVSENQKNRFSAKLNNQNIVILEEIVNQKDTHKDFNLDFSENLDINSTAAILYTSGTTGEPKGVMLSSKNILINTLQGISSLHVTNKDRVFCALPLFHSLPQNTCIWSNVVLGSSAIIVKNIDRTSILEGLKSNPTIVVAVPALYNLFCLMRNLNFSKIRYFFSGGDALSDKTRKYFGLLYRRRISNGYGLTESSPYVAVDIDDYNDFTSTVGRPMVMLDIQIRDENLKILNFGEIGTLWIKGDNIMLGYYKSKEATDKVIVDGWLNTGDLAYINEFGKIVISGRMRDLIINKGLKIYPQEIENVLLSHKSILMAAVIGMSYEDKQDEYPVAFLSTKDQNQELLIEELKKLCSERLALYKIPKIFILKSELPLTATGKVNKKLLKQNYEKST